MKIIPGRKDKLRRNNRAAILHGADALLRTRAVSALTMDEISREAGVARRTVYNHFANIGDLFMASRKAMLVELASLIPMPTPRTQPSDRALAQFAADTLRLLADPRHIDLYLSIIREARDYPGLVDAYDRALGVPLRQQVAALLASDGAAHPDDADSRAAEFIATLTAMAVAAHQFGTSAEWLGSGATALAHAFLACRQSPLCAAA